MSTDQPDGTVTALTDWAAKVAAALEVPGLDAVAVEQILALAGKAAHGVMRPAAPVTTFLAGLALGADPSLDLADVEGRVSALLPS